MMTGHTTFDCQNHRNHEEFMRSKTVYIYYRVEFLDDDGAWKDAGDVYEEETKRQCRKQMTCVNFYPHKIRMVGYATVRRQVSKIKDMSKCYQPRKKKKAS
jgi:hypothetical protein